MKISLNEDNEELLQMKSAIEDLFLRLINIVGREEAKTIKYNIEKHVENYEYETRDFIRRLVFSDDIYNDSSNYAIELLNNTVYGLNYADASWYGCNRAEELRQVMERLKDNVEILSNKNYNETPTFTSASTKEILKALEEFEDI